MPVLLCCHLSAHADVVTDLLPAGTKAPSGLLPRQLACPMRQMQHVGAAQGVFAGGPGHLLDFDAARAALHAAHAVQQFNGNRPCDTPPPVAVSPHFARSSSAPSRPPNHPPWGRNFTYICNLRQRIDFAYIFCEATRFLDPRRAMAYRRPARALA